MVYNLTVLLNQDYSFTGNREKPNLPNSRRNIFYFLIISFPFKFFLVADSEIKGFRFIRNFLVETTEKTKQKILEEFFSCNFFLSF